MKYIKMTGNKNSGTIDYAWIKSLFSWLFSIISFTVLAQENQYPEIGRRTPDFLLKNIEHFPLKSASQKEFRGKWLILEFWTSDCVSCIEGFPKLNNLYQQFKDSIQIILIGQDHMIYGKGTKQAKQIYERVRQKINLEVPVAYDTSLFSQFSVPGPPYVVWIDPKGIIRALTLGYIVNEKNIRSMLVDGTTKLPLALNLDQLTKKNESFDYTKPYLVNNNGGNDSSFLYRSLFSKWTPDMEQIIPEFGEHTIISSSPFKGLQLYGVNLEMLYEIAYFGTSGFYAGDTYYGNYWPGVILETSDSTDFRCDFSTGFHLYCYSLLVPKEKSNTPYLKAIMQDDLKHYFGYKVKIETRLMPCWNLVSIRSGAELKTKGGVSSPNILHGNSDAAGFSLQNSSVGDLISRLSKYVDTVPIIDQTGISGNIDIQMDTMMINIDSVRKGLQQNGLDFVKGEKEMNVIVISDL